MSVRNHHRAIGDSANGDSAVAQNQGCLPPAVEPLEARRLMAVGTPAQVWVDGTSGADTIRLRQSGSVLSVTRNGSTTTYNTAPSSAYPGGIAHVTVNGWGGNDIIQADS